MLLKISTNPHLDEKDQKNLFKDLSPDGRRDIVDSEGIDKSAFAMLKSTINKSSKIVVK